jgi:hypothetical protein
MRKSQVQRLAKRAIRNGYVVVPANHKAGRYALVPLPVVSVPDWAPIAGKYISHDSRRCHAWLGGQEVREAQKAWLRSLQARQGRPAGMPAVEARP